MRRLGDWLIRLLRAGLALAALGLVLLALYVSVGRELTPLVAEYHAEIERRGSEALGLPLRIGRLQGEWSGLAPRLVARDVQLGEGDELLQRERIAVVPAVLDSLLARAPRLRHLELSGLHLMLREDAEGRWQVDGLPRPKAAGGSDPRQLLAAPLCGGRGQVSLLVPAQCGGGGLDEGGFAEAGVELLVGVHGGMLARGAAWLKRLCLAILRPGGYTPLHHDRERNPGIRQP